MSVPSKKIPLKITHFFMLQISNYSTVWFKPRMIVVQLEYLPVEPSNYFLNYLTHQLSTMKILIYFCTVDVVDT